MMNLRLLHYYYHCLLPYCCPTCLLNRLCFHLIYARREQALERVMFRLSNPYTYVIISAANKVAEAFYTRVSST